MRIDRVTFSGVDDTVSLEDMIAVHKEYPHVEWGILLSKGERPKPRYPTTGWVMGIAENGDLLKLSGHLCGRWMRELVLGYFTFLDTPTGRQLFKQLPRIQINFAGLVHEIAPTFYTELLVHGKKQFIFQMDGVNDYALPKALEYDGLNVVPLFDKSGGTGKTPIDWPVPMGDYCGYAGGLGPNNLKEELHRIEKVVGDKTIWIDMETQVRTMKDEVDTFDLEKVRACLEIVTPWVGQ